MRLATLDSLSQAGKNLSPSKQLSITIPSFPCSGRSELNGKNVYLIGIGGTGMSALASLLLTKGYKVSGSELQPSSTTAALEKLGARITDKQDGKWVNPETELVVFSAAITEDNPDLKAARSSSLEVVKYSQFLGSLMKGKNGIAISGTHGKTTTASMVSTVLKYAGMDPSFVIGGVVPEIGGCSYNGKGNFFVAEACEYDRSFLSFSPYIGVITNVEEEHLDYYKDIEDIISAFAEFAASIPEDGLLVVNSQDNNIKKAIKGARCNIQTYSADDHLANWTATRLQGDNSFEVFHNGSSFGEFRLRIPGVYNIMNALATIAICTFAGVEMQSIRKGLATFNGAQRRFQIIGSVNGITVVDDYGHHPTEIRATLRAAREMFPEGRIWCIFQPHQYNRTRILLKDFAHSFDDADKVILTDIYPVRDNEEDKAAVNSYTLANKVRLQGVDALYIPRLNDVVDILFCNFRPNDVVVTMGAGDIWKVSYSLISRLREQYSASQDRLRQEFAFHPDTVSKGVSDEVEANNGISQTILQ
ncbi:MAG: UDP-N-acetylmuramate--L-alanine ligase [Candidatus Brocadiales bacterium]